MEKISLENIIEQLLNRSIDIFDDYGVLFNLEMQGKLDTEEFKQTIERIRLKKTTEDILIDEIFTNDQAIDFSLGFFQSELKLKGSQLFIGIGDTIEALVVGRLYNKILLKYKEEVKKEDITLLKAFLKDQVVLTLAILAKDGENNEVLRERATELKSQLAFILESVEKDLLDNKFCVDINPYLEHKFMECLCSKENTEVAKEQIREYIVSAAITYATTLLTGDELHATILSFIRATFRSLLVLADEETEIEIRERIAEMLSQNDEETLEEANSLLYENYEEDRKIPTIVTLGS